MVAPATGRTTPQGASCHGQPCPFADVDALRTRSVEPGSSLARQRLVDALGRIQGRNGDGGQQGRDTVQKGFHRAGTGQVGQEPVFVLFDLCRHFEEGHNHGGGLGLGEPRVLEGVRAQRIFTQR